MKKKYNFKEEMEITTPTDTNQQMKVIVYPKKKPKHIPSYDNIFLSLESIHADQEGMVHGVYLTPDEALTIANMLTTAVEAFLCYGYKPYDIDFNEPRRKMDKERKKRNKL